VDKLRTSEWLVARVTSTERAEEIIGDLAEQNLTVAHYWVAVLRICLAFTWRWIVGVPAAMLSFLMLGVPYFQILKPQVELAVSHGHDLEHDRIIKLSLYLFLSSVALASIMVLSLTRYGQRSVVTRLAAVLTFTISGSAFAFCAHQITTGVAILVAAALLSIVAAWRYRRPALAVIATFLGASGLFFVWSWLVTLAAFHLSPASPVVSLVFPLSWLAMYIGIAFLLSRSTRWLRVVVD